MWSEAGKQTDWKKIASDTYEAAFEISLRNHKKEDVTVKVIEPIPGDWTMLSSSHEYKKTEAFTAEFSYPGSERQGNKADLQGKDEILSVIRKQREFHLFSLFVISLCASLARFLTRAIYFVLSVTDMAPLASSRLKGWEHFRQNS